MATLDEPNAVAVLREEARKVMARAEQTDSAFLACASFRLMEAADRLLVLETRISALFQWTDNSNQEPKDEHESEWDRGWEVGYSSAARMAACLLRRDEYSASGIEAPSGGETGNTDSTEGESPVAKPDAQETPYEQPN